MAEVIEQGILVQLPSKDLWRGFDPDWLKKRLAKARRLGNVEVIPDKGSTAEEAIEAAGDECPWCGMVQGSKEAFKAHVEELHFNQIHMKEVTKEEALQFLTGATEVKKA